MKTALVTADLLAFAQDLGQRAAVLISEGRPGAITEVSTKSSEVDVVTAMDKHCEDFLVEQILDARPQDGIKGEEHGERAGSSGVRWIIDPIDGTVNYLYGIPDYAVSIAVEVDGAVLIGVVTRGGATGQYHAIRGGGAFLDDRPLRSSQPKSLAVSLVGTGFGYKAAHRARQAEALSRLIAHVRDIRRSGSAALDLCFLAEGRLDAYYEEALNEWDFAAGALIAQEAGCVVSTPTESDEVCIGAARSIAQDFAALVNSARGRA